MILIIGHSRDRKTTAMAEWSVVNGFEGRGQWNPRDNLGKWDYSCRYALQYGHQNPLNLTAERADFTICKI